MKSFLGSALIAALSSTAASAAPPSAPVDAYKVFLRAELRHEGVDHALAADTSAFTARFLTNPSSPYSDLIDTPLFTNEIWWPEYVHRMRTADGEDTDRALATLQLQSGFTKARPGKDVEVTPAAQHAYRGREVAANAVKAGVDSDIFWQAFDMSGTSITAAAGHALALQILRDAAAAHDPADYGRMAIKPDVLSRYLRQQRPDRIPEADLRYLADLLRGAIQGRGAPLEGTLAQRLPAAYRLARVAAAYADSKGYYSSRAYCAGDAPAAGQPTGPEALGFDRPLCFIAATDRGVQAWFRRQLRIDALKLRIHENPHRGFERFAHLLGTVLIFMDMVAFIEVADALVADELATEGAIDEETAERLGNRANRLTCRINR